MSTDARVTALEQAMAELALAQARTQANIDRTQANIDRTHANIQASIDRTQANIHASIDRTQANIDRTQANIQASIDRTQARIETNIDRLFQELKARDQATREETARPDAEFHAQMDARRARADKDAADHRKEMGELSRKMGTLTEDIVAPGIPDVFRQLFHVEVEECLVRQKPRHKLEPGRRREFDVVAWGGDVFLLNETRSTLRPSDVDEVLEALAEVRGFFPEAEGRRVLGALASFRADPSLVQAAERRGLLVFGLSSGLLDVLNTPGFRAREF